VTLVTNHQKTQMPKEKFGPVTAARGDKPHGSVNGDRRREEEAGGPESEGFTFLVFSEGVRKKKHTTARTLACKRGKKSRALSRPARRTCIRHSV